MTAPPFLPAQVAVFHENTTDVRIQEHMTAIKTRLTNSHAKSKVMFEYDTVLKGYSLHDEAGDVLPYLQGLDSDLKYLEANQMYHANQDCDTQTGATWGLVRTTRRELVIDGVFTHKPRGGAGVRAYIIDTGVYMEHNEFEDRAVWGFDAINNPSLETDRNGHGTHVAGTVGGATYGIARGVTVVGVKVLGATGSGSTAGVIAGIDFSARDREQNGGPGNGNMSLGGGLSTAMNDATNGAVATGLPMIVASGNSNANACNFSPASATEAYTVNSMDNQDRRSTFSNFGTCSDLFAPGSAITSAWIGNPASDNTISGTSMAAPHVAGVISILQGENPTASPAQLYAMMTSEATTDTITNPGTGSPNLLLFKECL